MATCTAPGCGRDRQAGSHFCNIHSPHSKANVKAQAKSDKAAAAAAESRKKEAERLQKIADKNARAAAAAEHKRAHSVLVATAAQTHVIAIRALVQSVRNLRAIAPANANFNAGSNAGVHPGTGLAYTDITGGSNNPYVITGSPAVSKDEITHYLIENCTVINSDSALAKYTEGDIFIHIG